MRALSMVEVIIAAGVTATMVVASLSALTAATQTREHHAKWSRGPALAQSLMYEILQNAYEEPATGGVVSDDGAGSRSTVNFVDTHSTVRFGLEVSEAALTRADFDDVDDYHGWSASPPETRDGTALRDLAGWTRSAAVNFSGWNNETKLSDLGFKKITVTVTDAAGRSWSLAALRCRIGVYDQVPVLGRTSVHWTQVELQIGNSNTATAGAVQVNQPVD
jgi:hypothetical protein